MNQHIPVAIVGIGCRFPGGVSDARSFWQLLSRGQDAIGDIPVDRIDLQRFYDPRPATPGHMVTRRGGFVGSIDQFDAAFFGISPREAERIDPQQRLLLESAWEALEDAGADPLALRGSRTGVYVGQWVSDFESRLFADPDRIDFLMTTGSGRYAASGRLSYALGLRGPSLTLDTACSSSLVAVHLATRALRSGECTSALAGGVNLILQPYISVAYSQSRMMAPDGHCKFGDASGDGYVRSEGAGVVVLKRLDAALADGDRIYAVIRGSATNNDGQSSGVLGRPSGIGHRELLRSAYADAGVAPGQVAYVEAHGTGTRAGDPVEIGALGEVLGEGRAPGDTCLMGSVKTNIGHTESAAGVAGLIKAALALHEAAVPPSLHFHEPNPLVPWATLPLVVPQALTPWPADGRARYAGVNSFGISGTNAHVVLESAPQPASAAEPVMLPHRPALLVLSARSPAALRALAGRYAVLLTDLPRERLDDACWAAATRRAALEQRAAFLGADAASLVAQLKSYASGEAAAAEGSVLDGATGPVFVLPGQGGQWVGMARGLMCAEPAYREALMDCDAAARPWLQGSIAEQLALDEADPGYRLDRIEFIQPALVAMGIAYGRWLQSLGIAPAALVGHSMGEVAAAHLAGALPLEQAMRIICRRSALMGRLRGQGAMAMVALPMREAQRRLAGHDALSVAAANAPASCVISGEPQALLRLMNQLEADGVFCRLINVDVASHSAQMDEPAAALALELADLMPGQAAVPLYSTVLGDELRGAPLDAAYWARNLRQPVRFEEAIGRLFDAGARCFVELGPHAVLAGGVQQHAQARQLPSLALACGERDEPDLASALRAVARLWTAGVALDWPRLLPRGRAFIDLPLYPWQRERHWCEAAEQTAARVAAGPARRAQHPLLAQRFDPAGADSHCWQGRLDLSRAGFLADHVVRGSIVYPAAGHLDVALAAASEARPGRRWGLREVEFHSAWALQRGTPADWQLRLDWCSADAGRFEIHVQAGGSDSAAWERCASGHVVACDTLADPLQNRRADGADAAASRFDAEATYVLLADAGLAYGPAFRALTELWADATGACAGLDLDAATLDPAAARHAAYPPLLDAALQAVAAWQLQAHGADAGVPLPVRLDRLDVEGTLAPGDAYTLLLDGEPGDVDLIDAAGRRVAALRGLHFARLRPPQHDSLDALLQSPRWVGIAAPEPAGAVGCVVVVGRHRDAAQPWLDALTAQGLAVRWLPVADLAAAPLAAALAGADGRRAQLVHLAGLELAAGDRGVSGIEADWQQLGDDILSLARALAAIEGDLPPRVWLPTQQAVAAADTDPVTSLGGAALWGLGRVWAHEHPELDLTLVDLDGDTRALPALLQAAPSERQLACRAGTCLALRLLPSPPDQDGTVRAEVFEAGLGQAGGLDSLRWQVASGAPLQADEVEIDVEHAGLNFMNLMSVLGIYPCYDGGRGPLGIECAGRIRRVGSQVNHLRVGDAVVAIGHDCLRNRAVLPATLVARRPATLASADAAAAPIAFLTATHALLNLARLERGERVLIHSAAGGVGLAALQVARRVGAEVCATAGTEDKRALLRSWGVEKVFDSRSTDFAEQVLAATGGRGVDVVLNALAGDAIAAGLRCLAPYGRFVELGKRDIYGGTEIALAPFRANLSYFAVDLDRMMRERPARLGEMLRTLMADLGSGAYQPLIARTYAPDRLADAFRDLIPGTHVGKHVVALDPAPSTVAAPAGRRAPVRADGCYVITGGLGALGLALAQWLGRRGAGALMLIGRQAPSPGAAHSVRDIEACGTRVLIASCDVADTAALATVLERARREAGPLRGVFHAAGTLADAMLTSMTPQQWRAPLDAKVLGAWNLARLTEADPLDTFMLFSSVASLFGTPGQGNYAAANAFLDGLAWQQRARGRPALALNLGPVAAVGLAAASSVRGDSLRRIGFDGIGTTRVIEAIDRLWADASTQVVCAAFDPTRWASTQDRAGAISLFDASMRPADAARAQPATLRDELLDVPAGPPRRALLEAAIKAEVAAVLRLAAARVPSDRALRLLGLDSLMALELRNRLEQRCAVSLSPTLAWNHPTVQALAGHLAERLQVALDPPPDRPPPSADDHELAALLDEIEGLSDDEARRLLDAGGSP